MDDWCGMMSAAALAAAVLSKALSHVTLEGRVTTGHSGSWRQTHSWRTA